MGSAGHAGDAAGQRLADGLFACLMAIAVLAIATLGPFLTNDGPVHVGMASLLNTLGRADTPLQNAMFVRSEGLSTNVAGYRLLAAAVAAFGPETGEKLFQILCVTLTPLAGWLALNEINPRSRWLALFLIPAALQKMFFLGTYNFVISLAGVFLAVWAALRHVRKPGLGAGALAAVVLCATLAVHPGGYVPALMAYGTIVCGAVLGQRTDRSLGGDLGRLFVLGLPAAPSMAWMAQFALSEAGQPTSYGFTMPLHRLKDALTLRLMGPSGPAAEAVALAIALVVALLAAAALRTLLRRPAPGRPWLAWTLLALSGLYLAAALAVPDKSGGGWTHAMRMQLLPFFGFLLALAAAPIPERLARPGMFAAAGLAALALAVAVHMQQFVIRPEAQEFAAADRLVGAHCTVLPILYTHRPGEMTKDDLDYEPLHQAANRLDASRDRVVLYNFLARLTVYPVRFRPGRDTQQLIYHWPHDYSGVGPTAADIDRFERVTRIPVNYVLIWREPTPRFAKTAAHLGRVLSQRYSLAYRSASGRLRLYQRRGAACGTRLAP